MRRIIGGIFTSSEEEGNESLLVQGDAKGLTLSFTDSNGDAYESIRLTTGDTIELGRLLDEIEKHQRASVDPR